MSNECECIGSCIRYCIDEVENRVECITNEIHKWELVTLTARVHEFGLTIFYTVLACALFRLSSSSFAAGMLYSLINPQFSQTTIQKIQKEWSEQNFALQSFVALIAILAWPMTGMCAAFIAGAHTRITLHNLATFPISS